MSIQELEETIELLRQKLFGTASSKGFSDERTIIISQSLDLYITRYNKLMCSKCKAL
ncbi:Spo0E family sporulation regulatory protein-aspartic acid phosphatase [Neobacillus sp. PS3-40]|uniref:Spo0E family sporulation regulatory protein-aspartic acid phosphatase n=1 Tax=Neobacillus sp. PS3-40 TaxID=3070679 RepID=UPI0035A83197